MAEVLIKLEPCDAGKDPFRSWNRLHPICVKPNGWAWGALERPPKFLVIRITDMTVAEVEPYLEADEYIGADFQPVVIGVRKWKFDIDDLTIPNQVKNAIRNAINNRTILSVTKAQIVNFIKRTQ